MTTTHKNLFIVAMIMSFSMIFLNESGAIGVAFPKMQLALNMSNHAISWVMNAFLLTTALLLLLGGKLADHYGCRKIFMLGIALFAAASLGCACATSAEAMIAGRVLQAMGASLAYPSGSALISLHVDQKSFAKVYGTVLGVAYIFVAFGPFIGGLFTHFLSWRWLFLVNIGFSVVCLSLTLYVIPKDIQHKKPLCLDVKGLCWLMVGLGSLVVALMQGEAWGWTSGTIVSLGALAFVGLGVFIRVELTCQNPLLAVRLFCNKVFVAANLIFASVAACFTALVFWAIWLQQTLNYSPVTAGLAMIPATVISLFMLRISGAWGGRVGPRKPMLVGAWLLTISLLWIAMSAKAQSYPIFFWGLLCFGFATPLIIPNSIGVLLNCVKLEQRGSVSGIYLTLQHVAFTLGFAMLSAIMSGVDNQKLGALLLKPQYSGISVQQVQLLLLGKNTLPPLSDQAFMTLKQTATLMATHAFSCGMLALSLVSLCALGLTLRFIPAKVSAI